MSKIGQQSKKCFKCGENYPHSSFCLAESKFCNRCGKQGRSGNCCKTKMNVLLTQKPLLAKQNVYQNPINQITHSLSNPNMILPRSIDLPYMNNDSDDEAEYLLTVYNMSNSQKEHVVESNEKKV